MKIVIISDTHNQHDSLGCLSGDVLIHCGDMLDLFDSRGSSLDAIDKWFGKQNFDLILCTGGNHDLDLEERLQKEAQPFNNAIYLQDAAYVHRGVTFWGAPWTPDLPGHAFFKSSHDIRQKWAMIPKETDVLITHTPPHSILDVTSRGVDIGCGALQEFVTQVVPSLHCFGHVHHSRGELVRSGTRFVNASSVGRSVQGVHPPIVVAL